MAEVTLRTNRACRHRVRRILDRPENAWPESPEIRRSLGGTSCATILKRIREREQPFGTVGLADIKSTIRAIQENCSEGFATASDVERIRQRRIILFNREFDLSPSIEWHRDPMSGMRWPLDHYTRVPLRMGGGSDVRVVWELNRLHHFVSLGRAYCLTNDETIVEEFLSQFASWKSQNPPNFGVNWTVSMEVGIRITNLLTAFRMFADSPLITEEVTEQIVGCALAHGRYIRSNLEYSHRVRSNHYLSNLIGLFVLSVSLPELLQSQDWLYFSTHELMVEFENQVLPDGVSFEQSIGYHRLVLEIYSLFFSIGAAVGIKPSDRFTERLYSMFDFVKHYLKPNGEAPSIGDSDDGRLVRFTNLAPSDHRYLLDIGAVMLDASEFKQTDYMSEEAIWFVGSKGFDSFAKLPKSDPPQSCAFPHGQLYIQRTDDLYSIIDCGDHGALGMGSHAHSDALSFEIYGYGETLLRDPGTFVYTGSERWRNRFRSTEYHNTVRIDGLDISEIRPGELFALGPNVRPIVSEWTSSEEKDLLVARHRAYARLPEPIIHTRTILFSKRKGYWTVEDLFQGSGEHRFEAFFNFEAQMKLRIEENRIIATGGRAALAIVLQSSEGFQIKRTSRWVSPAYGTRISSSGIIFRLRATAPARARFLLIPYEIGKESRIEKIVEA